MDVLNILQKGMSRSDVKIVKKNKKQIEISEGLNLKLNCSNWNNETEDLKWTEIKCRSSTVKDFEIRRLNMSKT